MGIFLRRMNVHRIEAARIRSFVRNGALVEHGTNIANQNPLTTPQLFTQGRSKDRSDAQAIRRQRFSHRQPSLLPNCTM